jgi:hypothetical protein
MGRYHYVFPKWSNLLLPTALLVGGVAPLYAVFIVAYGFSPKTTDVGYRPVQPIPFSHALHAGDLGMDCRYCHNTVERAAHAAIPPTQTCMNCHTQIHKDSRLLEPLRVSYATGESIPWVRVHDLPGYAYFSHAAHVNRGVSCVECHGRIDRMEVVQQHATLAMGWCLDCHRNPDSRLRDPELVTDLGWFFPGTDAEAREEQSRWRAFNQINPSQDCSTCHR